MPHRRKTVVISLLGTTLDAGIGPARWNHWRPTVSMCQHEDLVVHRLELLRGRRSARLARVVEQDILQVSPETEVRAWDFELRDPWDFEEVYASLHDFASAYPFAPEREDYLVHITTGTHVAQICMFLLCEARYIPGRLLQTGPGRKGQESAGTWSIVDLDLSRYDRIASRFRKEQKEGLSFLKAGIDTRNETFNRMIERIEQVAIASSAPILLMGPTGAGKSQLARRIHELKRTRRQVAGPLVEVNCATLRGDGAMSSLFGHVRGAFTGAVGERSGLLRKANEGVLFLDEIGELGPDEQAMMLRALELKEFYPVGSDKEVRSDFQLIAGTNRDLAAAAAAGRFRADLLARIHLWTFVLPGLAQRREDIEPNLDYELSRASESLGRHITINREAREALLRFALSPSSPWTGNFRDLNACVLRMATLAQGGRITPPVVREEIERLELSWAPSRALLAPTQCRIAALLGREAADALDRFDRVQLEDSLEVCARSQSLSEAGRVLFANSRAQRTTTNDADRLRKYLARFGLSWQAVRESSTG